MRTRARRFTADELRELTEALREPARPALPVVGVVVLCPACGRMEAAAGPNPLEPGGGMKPPGWGTPAHGAAYVCGKCLAQTAN